MPSYLPDPVNHPPRFCPVFVPDGTGGGSATLHYADDYTTPLVPPKVFYKECHYACAVESDGSGCTRSREHTGEHHDYRTACSWS